MKVEKGNKMLTRKFLSSLSFRPFDKTDYYGFAGVQSPVPLIAEFADKYLVIIDGDYAEIIDIDGEMVEFCDNIRDLA